MPASSPHSPANRLVTFLEHAHWLAKRAQIDAQQEEEKFLEKAKRLPGFPLQEAQQALNKQKWERVTLFLNIIEIIGAIVPKDPIKPEDFM